MSCGFRGDGRLEAGARDDWKKVFENEELDRVITRMLKIKEIRR